MKIGILVGSLRKESFNRKTARNLISLAPKSLEMEIIEIGDLPLYNEDLDGDALPSAWKSFRQKIKSQDGIIFVTPEYNRSVPAALKNAIDVGSRPYGKSSWSGKPAGVISVSPGAIGGFGANQHIRQSFVFLDMPILQQPEMYLGHAGDMFDESGSVKNEKTKALLIKFLDSYTAWVAKIQNYKL